MTNVYADRATFKSRLGITATTADADILAMLLHLSRAIDEYCGRTFYTLSETRYFDGAGLTLLLDRDLIGVSTLKTDDDDDGVYETTWAAADYILLPYSSSPRYALTVDRRSSGSKSDFNNGIQRGVEVAGLWGYAQTLARSPSVAAEAMDTSETGFDVTAGADFGVGQTILVDSEQMYISAIAANTLTVTRGMNGTTAASHSNAAVIDVYHYPQARRRGPAGHGDPGLGTTEDDHPRPPSVCGGRGGKRAAERHRLRSAAAARALPAHRLRRRVRG